ncbi:uncharacterized protein LOC122080952 [Macadamia integrifolia]|uniref:uncharacterized protein LOC122080952 n=1 Tax=Macadamia integrifolia TaxID=60698 RepID=UPI001C4E6615|nr:uncharacterized protein LOC122080952 [Macadamia integrifolia]
MSVMSSLLLFFLLNLSDYLCNASRFSFMEREETSRQIQLLPGQDMEKAIPLKVKLSMSKEVLQKRGQGLVGANTPRKLKDTKAFPKGVEEKRETISGIIQIIMHSSDDVVLRQATTLKGSGRRVCSLVGSASPVNKEMVDSKENDDISEDVVVMDYQQPHRKPPIHNASP